MGYLLCRKQEDLEGRSNNCALSEGRIDLRHWKRSCPPWEVVGGLNLYVLAAKSAVAIAENVTYILREVWQGKVVSGG